MLRRSRGIAVGNRCADLCAERRVFCAADLSALHMGIFKKAENRMGAASGTVLASCVALAVKGIGALYKIPLYNLLGDEATGLYGMIFPLFAFLICISGTGIPSALTGMISGGFPPEKVLKKALLVFCPIGAFLSVGLFVLSDKIAILQGERGVSPLYKAIAPSVFAVTVISVFRGYFQGLSDMRPTALSQLTEQASRAVIGLIAAYLLPVSAKEKAFFAVLAITASEFFASLYCILKYFSDKKKKADKNASREDGTIGETEAEKPRERSVFDVAPEKNGSETEMCGKSLPVPRGNESEACKNEKDVTAGLLAKYVLPLTLSSLLIPFSALIEGFIATRALIGMLGDTGTAYYGLYTGAAETIISLPAAVLHPIALGFLPAMIRDERAGRRALLLTAAGGMIAAAFVAFFPNVIISLLFSGVGNKAVLKRLLFLSSFVILLLPLLQTVSVVMLSKGLQKNSLISNATGSVVKILVCFFFVRIPSVNVFALPISDVCCYFVALTLDFVRIIKYNKSVNNYKAKGRSDENDNVGGAGNGKRRAVAQSVRSD